MAWTRRAELLENNAPSDPCSLALLAEDVPARNSSLDARQTKQVLISPVPRAFSPRGAFAARQSIPRAAVTSTLRRSPREQRWGRARLKFRVNAKIDLAQISAFAGPPTAVDHGALRLQEGRRPRHLRKRSSSDAQGRWTALRHQDHRSKVFVSRRSEISPTGGQTAGNPKAPAHRLPFRKFWKKELARRTRSLHRHGVLQWR